MRLYEITDQFSQLDDFLPEIESMEDGQAYTELFDQLQGELSEKVHGCVCVIKNAQSEADALTVEIKRMTAKRKALENKASRVHDYLDFSLRALGQDHVKTSLFDVKYQKSPPSVRIISEIDLPDDCLRIKKEADKTLIKQKIQSGEFVKGAELVQDTRMVIK